MRFYDFLVKLLSRTGIIPGVSPPPSAALGEDTNVVGSSGRGSLVAGLGGVGGLRRLVSSLPMLESHEGPVETELQQQIGWPRIAREVGLRFTRAEFTRCVSFVIVLKKKFYSQSMSFTYLFIYRVQPRIRLFRILHSGAVSCLGYANVSGMYALIMLMF